MGRIIDAWSERRKWLEHQGFDKVIGGAANEIFMLAGTLSGEPKPDDFTRETISTLLETISHKLSDLAHGRLPEEILPKDKE